MSHIVLYIKLVHTAWKTKQNTVKHRIGKGLRGKNKELKSEFTNTWTCVNWWKMEYRFLFSSDVGKTMKIYLLHTKISRTIIYLHNFQALALPYVKTCSLFPCRLIQKLLKLMRNAGGIRVNPAVNKAVLFFRSTPSC